MSNLINKAVPGQAAMIAECFTNRILSISPLGNGLINDTYLVAEPERYFVLQRINSAVFPNPELIIANLAVVAEHIRQQNFANLLIPEILPTTTGATWAIDESGQFWRAQSFIANSYSFECLPSSAYARQTGYALGHFHRLLSDLDPDLLQDTLPGFHITPNYLASYRKIAEQTDLYNDFCAQFIDAFAADSDKLEAAKQQGLLKLRVIHGDPKLNNFLFNQNGIAISLIDLDTVKPGLLQYDIADCLRSCCHNPVDDRFDINCCEHILKTYLAEVKSFFSDADFDYLYAAIRLIPFELGLRFYTDYLQQNRYFKISYPEQNLHRAKQQFRLCASIDSQRSALTELIQKIRYSRHYAITC